MTQNGRTISGQLYQAVTDAIEAGWSINQIAQAAGIQQPSLQYWYSGARDSLALGTVAALCRHFGMRLTKPRIGKPPEMRPANRKPKAKKASPKRGRKKSNPVIGG